jgi:hypothetical protein
MTADRYVIQLNLRNQVVPQYIHLSWTPWHFGSYRPWMLCPYCRRRVARLFKGMGAYTALKDKSGKDVGVVELTQTPGRRFDQALDQGHAGPAARMSGVGR